MSARAEGTNTIFALATQIEPTRNVVWAFDLVTEYIKAQAALRERAIPFVCYHGVGWQNQPFNITAWHLTDEQWLALSNGLYKAKEVEFWIGGQHG